ncbi:MAG: hypothetical protein ACYSWZ_06460, partial [Planctomycetota bacterium]
ELFFSRNVGFLLWRKLPAFAGIQAIFFRKSSIFIEHSGGVWYNYNRPKKGRNLAENRKS